MRGILVASEFDSKAKAARMVPNLVAESREAGDRFHSLQVQPIPCQNLPQRRAVSQWQTHCVGIAAHLFTQDY